MRQNSLALLCLTPILLLVVACGGVGPTESRVTEAARPGEIYRQVPENQLSPPTSCTLDYIPPPHYLKVSWANGDASASTEVSIMKSPFDWQVVGTDAPGITQHFYVASSGLYYARVRHLKAGWTPSGYCNTNAKTVP